MSIEVTFHEHKFICDSCDKYVEYGSVIWDDIHIVNPLSCNECTNFRVKELVNNGDDDGN